MELLQLRYFLTVAELENISAAARIHCIPQPAMTSTIQKLEKELNVKLFDRIGNHLQLNNEGRVFFNYARRAIDTLSDGIQYINDVNGHHETNIRLIVNVNRDPIIDCMSKYQAANPEIKYTVFHHMQENGKDNPFDLCVTSYSLNQSNVKYIVLCTLRILLAIPPTNPLYEYDGEFTPDIIAKQQLIMTRATNDVGNRVRLYLSRLGIEPDIILNCNEPHYLKRYLQTTDYLAFVSESYSHYLPKDIRLIDLHGDELFQTVRMYWPTDRYLSRAVQELRKNIVTYFQNKKFPTF